MNPHATACTAVTGTQESGRASVSAVTDPDGVSSRSEATVVPTVTYGQLLLLLRLRHDTKAEVGAVRREEGIIDDRQEVRRPTGTAVRAWPGERRRYGDGAGCCRAGGSAELRYW